jgi:hypothetical protein
MGQTTRDGGLSNPKTMKLRYLLPASIAAVLTSCVVDDYDHGRVVVGTTSTTPVVTRRYVSYTDTDPYYRVYYRDGNRHYYRRHYYDDDPRYIGRIDTRRYYYRAPASHASVSFGY